MDDQQRLDAWDYGDTAVFNLNSVLGITNGSLEGLGVWNTPQWRESPGEPSQKIYLNQAFIGLSVFFNHRELNNLVSE